MLLFVFFDNAASIFVRFDRDAGVRKYVRTLTLVNTCTQSNIYKHLRET